MTFSDKKTWLETILGSVDGDGADGEFITLEQEAVRQIQRDEFMADRARTVLGENKEQIKETLLGLTLKGSRERGRLRPNETIKVQILEDLEGSKVPTGIQQDEWDSWAEVASNFQQIGTNGNMAEMGSEDAIAKINDIYTKLEPLMALSREMAAKVHPEPDGERVFSDRDIEKELWTPLVREGIIPSNLVPKKFSETSRVFSQGAAVYSELMAKEDGDEMGAPAGIDRALAYAKDGVNFGKVIGTEILRYDNLSVVEASRKDIASFLQNKNPMSTGSDDFTQLGGTAPADGSEGTTSPLKMTRDRFTAQKKTEGGQSNYLAWIASEEKRLGDPPEGSDEARQLEAIKAAKLTEEFGEYTRKQAMLNCAAAFAGGSVEAAQRARDRKKAKRDVAEAAFGGLLDAVMAGHTATQSSTDLTTDADTQTAEHKKKFVALAAKAGASAINNLSKVARPPASMSEVDRIDLLVNALGDVLDTVGEAIAASGAKTKNSEGTTDDTRYDRAQLGLLFKAAGEGTKAGKQLIAAAAKGDWAQVFAIALTAGGSGTMSQFAGQVGDLTRRDVDYDQIRPGVGDGDNASNPFATNPFEEVHGAAGQTGFGMSADMATMVDQRAAIAEGRALLDQIDAESGVDAQRAVAKKFAKIRAMAAANPQLAHDHAEIRAWLDLPEGEMPNAQDALAALNKLMGVMDDMAPQDAEAGAREDDAVIDALDIDADKGQLKESVGDMREMIDAMRAGGEEAPSEDTVYAKFEEIRDTLLQDERVLADIRSEMEDENAFLEDLKAQADLTRLENYTGEAREREREKGIQAIQLLTAELKKAEMRMNMLDQASKGAVGIALACVPGAALLGKIRDLVADMAKLAARVKDLRMWARQMEAMRGNYCVYEYAAAGHHDVMAVAVTHDSLTVAADIAGVAAESMRLADQTHIGAAVATSFEKIGKCLNEFWFKKYSQSKVASGWGMFKEARRNPEDRRLARAAIRENTTFAKCVLAYGACVDKDNQAQAAVQACGLTPELFESGSDTCQAVVQYLLAKLHDSEFKTIAAYDADANWLPCAPAADVKSWSMIKAAACQLDPAMDSKYFQTHDIDALMEQLKAMEPGDRGSHALARDLVERFKRYRPLSSDTTPQQHVQIIIVAQELAVTVERTWLRGRPDPDVEEEEELVGAAAQ